MTGQKKVRRLEAEPVIYDKRHGLAWNYIMTNPREFVQYAGKYVAISGVGHLVDSDTTRIELRGRLNGTGYKEVVLFIERVPPNIVEIAEKAGRQNERR
jgi:hypothetical protein